MATYNVAEDSGKLRLLISDVGGTSGSDFIFEDDEIDAFLGMNGDSIIRGAAQALRAIAGNEAQVSKRIKFLELSTDGPAVAKALNDLATKLDEQAEREEEGEGSGFEIAVSAVDSFSARNIALARAYELAEQANA